MIYTDFSVKNYRGIRQCKLEKLELINLFFGKNNCGKSSLLESLFILSGAYSGGYPFSISGDIRSVPS